MTEAAIRQDDWAQGVRTECADLIGRVGRLALISLAVFFAWALLLPLGTAVVAPGTLILQGQNKVLQHRAGGTIRKIHAREGDRLEAGALIYELDPATNQAELTRLRGRREVLSAVKARLDAEKRFGEGLEQSGLRGVSARPASAQGGFWGAGAASGPAAGRAVLSEQEREFDRGRRAILAELEALEKRAEGFRRQQIGVRQRADQSRRQVAMLEEQANAAEQLVKGGHISRQQLWDIQNRLLDRRAELAGLVAQNEQITSQIEETQSQIQQARMRDARSTSEKLTDVLGELEQTSDQLRAAEAELANTEIRAPVSGTLVHAPVTTIGAVVKPGETFGEVVPNGAEFDMQARVSPKDISNVKVGQDAEMRISALNQRIYEKVQAKVVYVAADASTDQRTGEKYFEVRARLRDTPNGQVGSTKLSAGMGGEVFIKGAPRTFASYLVEPIFDGLSRAFSERP